MARPNLIVCMCDELRAFGLGCYGHPTIRTPHLDRLATQGTRFEHGVSNEPVCMPARSMLLAGQFARTCANTVNNAGWPGGASFRDVGFPQWPTADRLGFRDATLPELLRGQGYATHAIGKWHIEAWPDCIGFDHYVIPAHHHTHTSQWFIEDNGQPFSPAGFSVDYEAQRVEQLLHAQRRADRPLFLYYNISPPHMPLDDAPEHYKRMYGEDDVVTRPNVDIDETSEDFTWSVRSYLWDYRWYRDHLPHTRVLPEGMNLHRLHALYMGLTSWVDDTVGRLMHALDSSGLAGDTVVVFTSDHGDNLGSHGRMGKGSLNEESIRVPMLVRGPGVAKQVNTTQVAGLIDLAPTLLRLGGAKPAPHLHGQDLTPVLAGAPRLERDFAFIETGIDGAGVRTPTHMLGLPWAGHTRKLTDAPGWFTDLRDDPYQLRRLRDDQPELRAELESHVRAWDAATPWLLDGDELIGTEALRRAQASTPSA